MFNQSVQKNGDQTFFQQQQQQQQSQSSPQANATQEEIRTIFLSGLPEDVKEREIHNLFRLIDGYEGCRVTLMNQRPVAFASFSSKDSASVAIQKLNGIKFDPDIDFVLRVEFARANSKVKRLINDSSNVEKRRRPQIPNLQNNGYGHQYSGRYQDNYNFGFNDSNHFGPMHNMIPHNQRGHPQQMNQQFSRLPQSTTLYVTGIDPNMTQNELVNIFNSGPGFQRFRLGKDGLHCFLEYTDLNASAVALNALNNFQCGNMKLRVDYARKKIQ